MNISQAAAASGLPIKTVRYYEEQGFVVPARQASNEYRVYSLGDVERLRFLQRLRAASFPLSECRNLLDLYEDASRRDADVKSLLDDRIQQVDQQLLALSALRQTLAQMVNECLTEESKQNAEVKANSPKYSPMRFTLVETGPD